MFEKLHKVGLLTLANRRVVLRLTRLADLGLALNHLATAKLLTQAHFDVVSDHQNAFMLAMGLVKLDERGILTSANLRQRP